MLTKLNEVFYNNVVLVIVIRSDRDKVSIEGTRLKEKNERKIKIKILIYINNKIDNN